MLQLSGKIKRPTRPKSGRMGDPRLCNQPAPTYNRWREYKMLALDLSRANVRDLLSAYADIMKQLRERKVVRSANNPVADYCEGLVVRALKLKPLPRSNKGCDAEDESSGKKYEIKGRRVTKQNPSTQLSVIRDLDSCHFDYLVGVLFDDDFVVTRACCIPYDVVKDAAGDRRDYVNGWILHLRPSLWARSGVLDITAQVRKAQVEWV